MKSAFWGGFFSHFEACGRESPAKAGLLLMWLGLASVIVGLIAFGLAGFLANMNISPRWGEVVGGVGLLVGLGLMVTALVLQYRSQRPARLGKLPPLASVDLRAARARLQKEHARRFPANRTGPTLKRT